MAFSEARSTAARKSAPENRLVICASFPSSNFPPANLANGFSRWLHARERPAAAQIKSGQIALDGATHRPLSKACSWPANTIKFSFLAATPSRQPQILKPIFHSPTRFSDKSAQNDRGINRYWSAVNNFSEKSLDPWEVAP
jgi:hypothetical protein